MLMLGCDGGDLVQSLREKRKPPGEGGKQEEKKEGADELSSQETQNLVISRVTLTGGAINHREAWANYLVPRLYDYVRFVYKLRADDDFRRAWLLSSEDEKWAALCQTHLPYLTDRRPRSRSNGGAQASSQASEVGTSTGSVSADSGVVEVVLDDGVQSQSKHKPAAAAGTGRRRRRSSREGDGGGGGGDQMQRVSSGPVTRAQAALNSASQAGVVVAQTVEKKRKGSRGRGAASTGARPRTRKGALVPTPSPSKPQRLITDFLGDKAGKRKAPPPPSPAVPERRASRRRRTI